MRFLPVGLDTAHKNILIFGGGFLALSALKSVIDTEAEIYMIAESFGGEILEIEKNSEGKLKLKEMEIPNDFQFMGYDFVIIATENFELNEALENRASARNMIYERYDIFSKSNMSINKSVTHGPLTFSINDSRLNPTITDIIYEDLQKFAKNYDLEKIKILNEIRSELVRKNSQDIDEIIRKLYKEEVINLSTFLKGMEDYKIEDIDTTNNFIEHITEGKDLNLEKEEEPEEAITEGLEVVEKEKETDEVKE
ncbi:precorrin-2 dehydrogenase/sirohydrochlorin ferrochelatase family protein [Peptoniphilus sp.]|jgi:precorrin-2 dehydrogenase/sirohydrochlorin ferrochelatase|uniref:precorrin-2 dehydrogenase/sirohydrochlorin ferrochelatase family protein n=1 Tax=Peptoniphilus sp. TaxID=1971214 RepID=UPI003D91AF01